MQVKIRAYTSPTLVLLAYDWEPGALAQDFLGFAIERTPGFGAAASTWLPNRIGFGGPHPGGGDQPSNLAPIQKFLWWDGRIDSADRGATITYRVVPVTGAPGHLQLRNADAGTLAVRVPQLVENGIGVYFNRAVMSSQAFARRFPALETLAEIRAANEWLANGMEKAIPDYLASLPAQGKVEGAIYHLNDDFWTIPALANVPTGKLSLVYNQKNQDHESDDAIQALVNAGHPGAKFKPRTRGNIMHNKFLVHVKQNQARSVLMGSANFTTGGLTRQANVLHTIDSPQLASEYLARKKALEADPTMGTLAAGAKWSDEITDLPGQTMRVFFPPEKSNSRVSIDTVINSIRAADSSVIFCCFMPTDLPLINACLEAGDEGKMMFGLVDRANEPGESDPSFEPKLVIYHRSRDHRDVAGREVFAGDAVPFGFLPERKFAPGEQPVRAVRIHHKFVVIDAETDSPTIYTGSANMSNNSVHNNDENLLEISGNRQLAGAYLAEFLRLYEHYRARLFFVRYQAGPNDTFRLTPNGTWSAKYFRTDSPEWKARRAMAD